MKNIAKYFRHRETGFTLIELLITMAVLSILAATIIPNLSGFIKSGKVTAANAELGYVLTGAQAYYADHVNATADFTSTSLFDNGLISSKPTPKTPINIKLFYILRYVKRLCMYFS